MQGMLLLLTTMFVSLLVQVLHHERFGVFSGFYNGNLGLKTLSQTTCSIEKGTNDSRECAHGLHIGSFSFSRCAATRLRV